MNTQINTYIYMYTWSRPPPPMIYLRLFSICITHIESTVNTGACAVSRNSDIHANLCHKICGSEPDEANLKESRTANREQYLPKTDPV